MAAAALSAKGTKVALIDKNDNDRWFIYYEDSWVYFVQSWTGYRIFGFKLAVSSDRSANVIASWANRNIDEYRNKTKENDIQTINDELTAYLVSNVRINKPHF